MKVGGTKDLVFFLSTRRSADLTSPLRTSHVTLSRAERADVAFDVFKLRRQRKMLNKNTKYKDKETVYISF